MSSLTEALKSRACRQPDCPVRESDKCLEGLEPEMCSHFYWADSKTDHVNQELPADEDKPKITLFTGQDMEIEKLSSITYQWPTNVIIIIGESDAGKTTLLSSIFDLFQLRMFPDYYFSGSQTCLGFELKCHKSRESSNAKVPETDKTNTQAFTFLHLAIKRLGELTSPARHLLLSDIGGERFRDAASSSTYMREMSVMKLATHFTFLIDGYQLADKYHRTATIANAQQFIKRAIDVGNFDSNTNLQIVISKADEINDDSLFDFDQIIREPFKQKFSAQLGSLSFYKIAARAKKHLNVYEFGYGLDEVLNFWLQTKPFLGDSTFAPQPKSERWFERYSMSNG